ncbi:hypothetical protein GQ607_012724 [Colletotrichum asianum]|uniref:Uncharacterized protein n=1 Tax=Colletotrichum asianum TaxID=702518 RepID=A0A8H3W692_9PEZI|nr:hypothetical protein GQ607_012724 [Colletotrichum asianum]
MGFEYFKMNTNAKDTTKMIITFEIIRTCEWLKKKYDKSNKSYEDDEDRKDNKDGEDSNADKDDEDEEKGRRGRRGQQTLCALSSHPKVVTW